MTKKRLTDFFRKMVENWAERGYYMRKDSRNTVVVPYL